MNKNNTKKACKSSLKVSIEMSKDKLTSQAGLVPVFKFLEKIGLLSIVRRTVNYTRGANAYYQLSDAMYFTILGLIGGARYLSGVVSVLSDKVLMRIGGWLRIPVDTTLSRIFKGVNDANIVEIEAVNHRLRRRVWKKALRSGKSIVGALSELWVDGDSTVKTVYGKQEGAERGFNPEKRGALSYNLLVAFCAHTKEILQGWFRCGNVYTSSGIVEFLKQLLAQLNRGVRIVFRADSGFFDGKLLSFLESMGHGYLIKAKMKGLIGLLDRQEWRLVSGQAGWEQCEFRYACSGWERDRRFVAVRKERQEEGESTQGELLEIKRYDYFCYVVSEGFTPWQTHKKYGERATSETWIEEAKNQMALGHMKTEDFLANAALFQCAILAYNAMKWMALCSGDTILMQWEIQTVRTFLIRVAGKLITGSRQLKLKVPEKCLYPQQWQSWVDVGLV